MKQLVILSIFVILFATSVKSTCICTQEFNPVCAKSGKSYVNSCYAQCHKDEVLKNGYCSDELPKKTKKILLNSVTMENEGCICPAVFDPVCSKSGKTYSNACAAKCENDQVLTKGECKQEKPAFLKSTSECVCPAVYDPVCAKSGKTYSNSCVAKCSDDEVLSKGQCAKKVTKKKPCACFDVYEPVCSKSGKTFSNSCQAECQGEVVLKKGECQVENPVAQKKINNECICTKIYAPVCSKSGKTFGNECMAKCAGEKEFLKGACEEVKLNAKKIEKECVCPYIYLPVCSKSGKTYENECVAKCKNDPIVKNGECVAVKSEEKELVGKLTKVNENFSVEFSLENPTNKVVKFLKWGTPFDIAKNMFDIVTPSGKKAVYTGILIKRGEPTLQDYLTFNPNSKQSIVVDLTKYFQIDEVGTYKVTLSDTLQLMKTKLDEKLLITFTK